MAIPSVSSDDHEQGLGQLSSMFSVGLTWCVIYPTPSHLALVTCPYLRMATPGWNHCALERAGWRQAVLNDMAQVDKGDNARLSSFVGAIAIADLVKSTLGPKG